MADVTTDDFVDDDFPNHSTPSSPPSASPPAAAPVSASTSPATQPSAASPVAPAATSPVAEPAPATGAQPAPAFSVLEQLRQRGIDTSRFTDDSQAFGNVIDELGRYYRSTSALQQQLQAIPQLQAELAQLRAAQKPPEVKKSWWEKPEWNPAWMGQVRRDENGELVDQPGAVPGTAAKVKAYFARRNEILDMLAEDPYALVQPKFEEVLEERVNKMLEQRFGQQQEAGFVNSTLRQNSHWLFVTDPKTRQPIPNPMTGGYQPTQAGQLYFHAIRQAEAYGIQHPQAQHQWALNSVLGQMAQKQLTAAPAETNEQLKAQYLGGAAHVPSQAGSTIAPANPNAATSQNKNLTLRQRLEAALPDSI